MVKTLTEEAATVAATAVVGEKTVNNVQKIAGEIKADAAVESVAPAAEPVAEPAATPEPAAE